MHYFLFRLMRADENRKYLGHSEKTLVLCGRVFFSLALLNNVIENDAKSKSQRNCL